RTREACARLNAMLQETAQGNGVVKGLGREAHGQRRCAEKNERLFRLAMRASLFRSLPVTEVLAGVSVAAIIWFGGRSVMAGTRTQGDFFGFVAAVFLLYEPFKRLVRTNYTIQQGLAGAERGFEMLDTEAHIVDRPGAAALQRV